VVAKGDEIAGRRRRRNRWLIVIFTLILPPVLWFSVLEAGTAGVRSILRPATQAKNLAVPAESGTPAVRDREQVPEADRTPASTENCDRMTVLVDRSHRLPADYAPDDLVSLRERGVPTLGGDALLRREAAENLVRLVAAATAEGEELAVASAYRSYEDQRISYTRLVSIYGAGAGRTSAPPGHSQHQLGTAVDFTNAAVGYEVHRLFGQTSAFQWLLDHSQDHGFVLAYPSGGESKTGYRWEPWHYRYIGVSNAERMRESGLGLQGFLTREGVSPEC
jgi:zinc D-Ala-D-Ala carboxypeptidase